MSNSYIVSATRTPIGRFGGGLSRLSPVDLGAHAMTGALELDDLDLPWEESPADVPRSVTAITGFTTEMNAMLVGAWAGSQL